MLLGISYWEWIGYISSVIVAISLTMSSILKLRWINMIGAALFSAYGFAIGALPVALLNLFIVVTNIFYLFKIYSKKETFQVIKSNVEDALVQYFLDFNQADISTIFQGFQEKTKQKEADYITLLLMRDAQIAGVVCGVKKDRSLNIVLDYVLPPYRDLKPGDYLYKKNLDIFKDLDIDNLTSEIHHPAHHEYLLKMGFELKGDGKVYEKGIA